jgi:hypothetical protein
VREKSPAAFATLIAYFHQDAGDPDVALAAWYRALPSAESAELLSFLGRVFAQDGLGPALTPHWRRHVSDWSFSEKKLKGMFRPLFDGALDGDGRQS